MRIGTRLALLLSRPLFSLPFFSFSDSIDASLFICSRTLISSPAGMIPRYLLFKGYEVFCEIAAIALGACVMIRMHSMSWNDRNIESISIMIHWKSSQKVEFTKSKSRKSPYSWPSHHLPAPQLPYKTIVLLFGSYQRMLLENFQNFSPPCQFYAKLQQTRKRITVQQNWTKIETNIFG